MMNEPLSTCDPRRIEQCLADALTDDERAAFEVHLESCPDCRDALESTAAAPGEWQSARTFLSSDAEDASSADTSEIESIDGVLNALAPTDDPRMLGRLGGYEIAGVVGRGGMGVVLKALDPALNRFVAIKVLAPQLATSGAARQRFAREARAAASVVHENVVAIHAVADSGPLPYFVMPVFARRFAAKADRCRWPAGAFGNSTRGDANRFRIGRGTRPRTSAP